MKNILVTGGAGFIGYHLVNRLLKNGEAVIAVDNFSLGKRSHVEEFTDNQNYKFYKIDVEETEKLAEIINMHKIDMVYHLAANSDIQKSAISPTVDKINTFETTASVIEVMRRCNVKNLFFASTSAVYGERIDELLTENLGYLSPISYYGGAKLASEAFISAYTYMNDMNSIVFRFANVIGPHLTHGVIYDFVKKLKANSNELNILGDGSQCKPYIYIDDLIDAIIMMTNKPLKGMNIYNAGVDTATTVTEIADIICDEMDLKNVRYNYTTGNRGWKGDVPRFQFDLSKIHKQGWYATLTSERAVRKTIRSILGKE